MNILIIGGTRFLGRHLVVAARARGHQVTLFHRGIQAAVPDPDVETIHGDRNRDLAKLRGRRWDAVLDPSGYLPQSVRASAEALAGAVDRYVFISSVSVYADLSASGLNERAPVATLTDEELHEASAIDTTGPVSASTYGPLYGGLKALCEAAAEEVLPNRVLTIRAGLIVGAHDYTDRFAYWVIRVARGGEVLAPGRPHRSLQFIDARDVADWLIEMIERRQTGVFNASGRAGAVTMNELLTTCRAVSGSDARLTWVEDSFLVGEHVKPWTEMPLWIPEEPTSQPHGLMAVNVQKALGAGLRYRALHDTVDDVLRWYRDGQQDRPLRAGLDADREQALLQKWRDRV